MKKIESMERGILITLIVILVGVCLFATHRFNLARNAAFYWQEQYINSK